MSLKIKLCFNSAFESINPSKIPGNICYKKTWDKSTLSLPNFLFPGTTTTL